MQDIPNTKTIGIAIIISIILITSVFFAFDRAKKQQGQIVLPAGGTYLGPLQTPTIIEKQPEIHFSGLEARIIPVPTDSTWSTNEGKKFPYSFSYPSVLSLGVFPNDPYDGVTIFYGNTKPEENLFFRVENLTLLNKKDYIGKTLEYAQNWYKDYRWTGVSSVTAFTNSKGLTGYRAKYLDDKGTTPYDHVFFAVPNKPDLVIWISGKLFEPSVFDKLVDSVSWKQ